jgi:hypothetical protein
MAAPPWVNELHNKFSGRCFLFGTGPSLAQQIPILEKMRDEYTFTCNRMKLWKELPFTPWVHCLTEPWPIVDWGRAVGNLYDYKEASNRIACAWFPVVAPGWQWLPKAADDIQCRWQGYWGTQDFLPPLPTAWASPITIGQLALWMGFTELYLVGCDTTQDGQAWDVEKGRTKFPRSIRSILECADRAYRDVKRAGRILNDCTPGGRLNMEGAIPYRDLKDVLDGKKEATNREAEEEASPQTDAGAK